MGTTAHVRLADAAAEVQIDAIRSHTLLGTAAGATAPTGGVSAEQREAAEAVQRAMHQLDRFRRHEGRSSVAASELRAMGVVIDDDDTMTRLHESAASLRAAAAAADSALATLDQEAAAVAEAAASRGGE
jgi:hypothetical protein